MRSWVPSEACSIADRNALRLRIRGAVNSWLSRCSYADHVTQDILQTFDAMGLNVLHPLLFGWCYSLQNSASPLPEDIDAQVVKLPILIRRIAQSHKRAELHEGIFGAKIDVGADDLDSASARSRAELTAEEIHGNRCQVNVLSALTSEQISVVRCAFDTIWKRWPEVHQEIEEFVQQLTFFESVRIIGFVDFQSHGSIFLRRETIEEDAVRLAEEIIHESCHVRLNSILAVEPLFLNGEEALYSSPLRQEPRPMFGVFHQMYVLSRLLFFYDRFATETHRERRAWIAQALQESFAVVSMHAQPTPAGANLIESVRTLLEQHT